MLPLPVTQLIAATAIVILGIAATPEARSQPADIQTHYATQKGACSRGAATRVEITEGRITGPGFDCKLGKESPAGTGLVAYEAACMVDGKKTSRGIALDLGNHPDHFELSLPRRDDWLALYPCTKVPGLQ